MHPNPAFRKASADQNLALAARLGFGTLAVAQDGAPLLAHVPYVLDAGARRVDLHLARSNPIARACTDALPARLAVTGPHGYISPDWYAMDDQVPTWNYVAVHLTGTLRPLPPEALRPHLDALSAQFEAQLAPKPAWTAAKMPPEALDRLTRMILPFRLEVAQVDGTWKLAQNKPEAARLAAAGALAGSRIGDGLDELARLMRNPPDMPEQD